MSRRVIALTIEGLSPAALSPYGCSWLSTPVWNRLASQSLVMDRMIADSTIPGRVLESIWTCGHIAGGREDLVSSSGTDAVLITDAHEVADSHVAQARFEQQIVVPYSVPNVACIDVEQTALANLFAGAIELVASSTNELLWCHVSSLPRCFDVPRELCEPDESIVIPSDVLPPQILSDEELEPDERLGWMGLYGGQVRLLDSLMGLLDEAVRQQQGAALFVIAAVSGFSLGEAGFLGHQIGPALGPRVHLPCLVCDSNVSQGMRSPRICQPHQLGETVDAWLTGKPAGLLHEADPACWATESAQDWAIVMNDDDRSESFVTSHWLLHQQEDQSQLFRKPDDRFDINDISSRAGKTVQALSQHAGGALDSLRSRGPRYVLPEEVLNGEW